MESIPALENGTGGPALVGELFELIDLSWLLAIVAVFIAWIGSRVVAERLRPRLEDGPGTDSPLDEDTAE